MFQWLEKWRKQHPETVRFDETGVTRTLPDGTAETVRWDDLQEVFIITTDEGPFVDDVFWVLKGRESACLAPSEADGTAELVTRLQELPGFDNEVVILAMGSTENQRFTVWRRSGAAGS